MVTPLFRRRIRSQRGAELIEFALVLPILLLVFVAIVDFALVFQRFLTISNAAREGARIAVLPGYTQTDVQNRVTQYVREGTGDNTVSPTAVLTPVSIDPPGATPAVSGGAGDGDDDTQLPVSRPGLGHARRRILFVNHVVGALDDANRVVRKDAGGKR